MSSSNKSRPATFPVTLEPLERRELFTVNPTVVDVAVVYTPAARTSVGGLSNLTGRVERAVADTNYILANSNIDATVRLVSLTEVPYSESRSLGTDLSRLQDGRDGILDNVHALRNSTGVDLVHLLVADGDDGGRGYQLDDRSRTWPEYGFGVSQARYTNTEYIFAHEVMHNLGAGHDDGDRSPRKLPHAYAQPVKADARTVYTLLGQGTRIPYLSSPSLTWRGQTLGMAADSPRAAQVGHAADNVAVVKSFLPTVAANRAAKVPDRLAPAARFHQAWVSPNGRTLTMQIGLSDDTAVDVGTLDGGDIRVTGPGGFSRAASFVSADRGSNGGQRLARYTVDITGYPADAAKYSYSVNAGQIADTGGRTVAGGRLTVGGGTSAFADRAGPNLHTAMDLGLVNSTSRVIYDSVSDLDPSNYYRFTLSSATTVKATLGDMTADADLRLIRDANGNGLIDSADVITSSLKAGTVADVITRTLQAGTYALWVSPAPSAVTSYSLSIAVGNTAVATAPPASPPAVSTPASPGGSASVAGAVWRDNNGNGVRDGWEIGLSGWTVYADVNGNGRYDAGSDVSTTTGVGGAYVLSNLAPGSYVVRSVDQSGFRRTTAPSVTAAMSSGATASGVNFGHTPRVLLGGSVFVDANSNRLREAGESGAAGWHVYLDRNGNGRLDGDESWTTTDGSGSWQIRDAMAGTFVVRLAGQAGQQITTGAVYSLSLAAGETWTGLSFGVRRG